MASIDAEDDNEESYDGAEGCQCDGACQMLYATEAAAGAVHSLRRPVLHAQGAIKCPRNPHVAVALCSLALNMVALDSPATCLLCALALWAPLALQGA